MRTLNPCAAMMFTTFLLLPTCIANYLTIWDSEYKHGLKIIGFVGRKFYGSSLCSSLLKAGVPRPISANVENEESQFRCRGFEPDAVSLRFGEPAVAAEPRAEETKQAPAVRGWTPRRRGGKGTQGGMRNCRGRHCAPHANTIVAAHEKDSHTACAEPRKYVAHLLPRWGVSLLVGTVGYADSLEMLVSLTGAAIDVWLHIRFVV
ncbi:hypothetical protein H4582DRAFT_2065030 [Lactarius indigo]|nr:hypothetical protein H4582DRAFT_2065030 [Lactarius indigo]